MVRRCDFGESFGGMSGWRLGGLGWVSLDSMGAGVGVGVWNRRFDGIAYQ